MLETEWHPIVSRLDVLLVEGLCEIPLDSHERFRESRDRWKFLPNFWKNGLGDLQLGAELLVGRYPCLLLRLNFRGCSLEVTLVALLLPLLDFLDLVLRQLGFVVERSVAWLLVTLE